MVLARTRPTAIPSPRAPWGWAAFGALAGALVAFAAFAPARWAASAVARATADRVILDAPRGTVWNGSAQLLLTGGRGSQDATALPSRLQWRLRPDVAGLRLRIDADCCAPQPITLRIAPRWGGARVAVADGPPSQWPASLLAGLGTPWNTMQFEGELQLATRALVVEWTQGRVRVQGQADLQAMRMASRLSTLRPIGSYLVKVSGGDTPAVQLSTLEGSLKLQGSGQWVASRLRFSGEASAAPEHAAALDNLLNIIGRREGARTVITIG